MKSANFIRNQRNFHFSVETDQELIARIGLTNLRHPFDHSDAKLEVVEV